MVSKRSHDNVMAPSFGKICLKPIHPLSSFPERNNNKKMSFLGKKWIIQNEDEALDLIEKLLLNRQMASPEQRAEFFSDDIAHLHDPFLLKDMSSAIERTRRAIDEKQKIMIFGDYDVDGVSGTAILVDFLRSVGADVHYTLPHREKDGYGPKEYFMRRFAESGVQLVVTVDCGTSAFNEIVLANQLGMDVIVTDHHTMPEKLPPALAVINPHRPDCTYPNAHLSGSAVAFKFVTALAPHYLQGQVLSEALYRYLGLATLGLIADCMPLLGENRVMVKHGLNSLQHAHHPGLKALLQTGQQNGKISITSQTIGFTVGPRLNAAGRLDTPDHALQLLLGDIQKAEVLHRLNLKRRNVVDDYVAEAKAEVKQLPQTPLVIVLHKPHWPSGVLGLIASQMVEAYGRPAIIMQQRENELVASCRSLNGFDITQFLRNHAHELFITMGGHAEAGGFTLPISNLIEFKTRVREFAPKYIDPETFLSALTIDCTLDPKHLNLPTKRQLDQLEPFGQGNPEPVFLVGRAKIVETRLVGQAQNHLQLHLDAQGQVIKGIAFNFGEHAPKIRPQAEYDVVCTLDVNEWNGKKSLQLKVVDMRTSL